MTPIRFGNRKPKPTKAQLSAATAYWRLLVAGKPVPPGPAPGAYVPAKAVEDAA